MNVIGKKGLKTIESWNKKDEIRRMHLDEVNIVQSSALLQFVFFFSVTECVVARLEKRRKHKLSTGIIFFYICI
ncbi:hypothetical protein EUGRSUZ_B00334 [Eucalyptus grandis]|uniref:Uncharacterized protein n=2 Tax=Eucalyptus grandis TaxID=71139 RepID=A0ACC3LLT2_EUCGR|nr:hypothetical protein EUGRSUZ_B00334 [Eucalyptus grandis]